MALTNRRGARRRATISGVLEIRPLAASEVDAVTSVLGLARLYQGDGVDFIACTTRFKGTVQLRTGAYDVDDTQLIWDKQLAD